MSGTVGRNRPCVIEGCDRTRQRYSARCRVHIQELMTTAYRNPFTFCWHEPKGPRCYACLLEDEVNGWLDAVQTSREPRVLAKFQKRIDRSAGAEACWPFIGTRRHKYGIHVWRGVRRAAHRTAWELANGPIPEGLFVLHRCDNPPCCNPAHLFLGTHADNNSDRHAKGRSVLSGRPGASNSRARLTDSEVAEIRSLYGTGQVLQRDLGRRFGVSKQHIGAIIREERWPSREAAQSVPSGLGADAEQIRRPPEAPGHSGASTPGRILPSSGPELPRDVA